MTRIYKKETIDFYNTQVDLPTLLLLNEHMNEEFELNDGKIVVVIRPE